MLYSTLHLRYSPEDMSLEEVPLRKRACVDVQPYILYFAQKPIGIVITIFIES